MLPCYLVALILLLHCNCPRLPCCPKEVCESDGEVAEAVPDKTGNPADCAIELQAQPVVAAAAGAEVSSNDLAKSDTQAPGFIHRQMALVD